MVSNQPGMQANPQQVHDDLANLFSRNLTLNPGCRVSIPKEIPRHEGILPVPAAQPAVYSISRHYHHSAHVAKPPTQSEEDELQTQVHRPSSEPPQSGLCPTDLTLRNHGVDPTTLTPSQLQLFRIADEAQRLRLLELWSICPPNKAAEIPALAWSSTTIEQEEHMARMRYEQQKSSTMSLDETIVKMGESNWAHQPSTTESEPYMASGYEELMRRENERKANENTLSAYSHFGTAVGNNSYCQATDPVYKGPEYSHEQQMSMAYQYGAFEQFRANQMEADAMDVM